MYGNKSDYKGNVIWKGIVNWLVLLKKFLVISNKPGLIRYYFIIKFLLVIEIDYARLKLLHNSIAFHDLVTIVTWKQLKTTLFKCIKWLE